MARVTRVESASLSANLSASGSRDSLGVIVKLGVIVWLALCDCVMLRVKLADLVPEALCDSDGVGLALGVCVALPEMDSV